MISPFKLIKKQHLYQIIVILLLLLLLVIGAVPGYLTGKWQWKQLPSINNLKQLQKIRKAGLNVPGWQIIEQSEKSIGTHKWSWQHLKKQESNKEAFLLLLPQNGPKDQPEIEWIDVNSWGRWDVSQDSAREFTVNNPSKKGVNTTIKIRANFFRAVSKEQTFAVLQWYAMPNAGSTVPFKWFVADQLAQWRHHRVYWVAVTILVPIEPLGQVETSWNEVKSLGETVQQALMTQVL